MQRLVERRELIVRDATNLLDRLDVLLIKRVDDAADLLSLLGQANANRTAVDARTLMIEEAELNKLLQVVGDIGAEVVTARTQFPRGQLLVAHIVEQERRRRIGARGAAASKLILDAVEKTAVRTPPQRQCSKIGRLPRRLAWRGFDGFPRRGNGFHHDTSPVVVLSTYSTKLLSRL